MSKKSKQTIRNCILIIIAITVLTGSTVSYTAEEAGAGPGQGQNTQSPYKIPKSIDMVKKEPRNPGLGTIIDDFFDPTATHTGKVAEKAIKLANALADKAVNAVGVSNMVPKNKRAVKSINLLLKKQSNILKCLAQSPKGTKGFKHWNRVLKQNVKSIESKKVLSQAGKNKQVAIKAGGKVLQIAGTVYNGYCIYKDIEAIREEKYEHSHRSMRFISDALRSASIAANSFSMATLGKNPIAEGAALITGTAKDLFNSKTFSSYMNNTDNFITRAADNVADGVNSVITSPAATYIPELLITKWNRYWGTFGEEPDLDKLEEIHKSWLAYKETDEFKEKLMKMKLDNKPGNGIPALKPNVYLYPNETIQVSVYFSIPGLLESVIPDYPRDWTVTASPDGTIITKSGDEYRFLFYESFTWPFLFQTDEGWLIKGNTREEQFKDIMKAYGFTEEEIFDFVEFWTIRLDANADYGMYPQSTIIVDRAMPIKITPEPDTLFRLWFTFEKDAIPPNNDAIINPIIRDGFTVIEWGGVILP